LCPTPAAPTAHERQALRASRQARRVAFSTFIEKVFFRIPRIPFVAKPPRVNSPY
jgi:hypothetical protein